MSNQTKLQEAFVKNALKRHRTDYGKYILVNVDSGDSFAGTTSIESFDRERYWYGPFALYDKSLGRSMVGLVIPRVTIECARTLIEQQRIQHVLRNSRS